jgi:hypothetical protein
MVLQDMVRTAQAAEIAAARQNAVVEGNRVAEVTAPGRLPTPREPAS